MRNLLRIPAFTDCYGRDMLPITLPTPPGRTGTSQSLENVRLTYLGIRAVIIGCRVRQIYRCPPPRVPDTVNIRWVVRPHITWYNGKEPFHPAILSGGFLGNVISLQVLQPPSFTNSVVALERRCHGDGCHDFRRCIVITPFRWQ